MGGKNKERGRDGGGEGGLTKKDVSTFTLHLFKVKIMDDHE